MGNCFSSPQVSPQTATHAIPQAVPQVVPQVVPPAVPLAQNPIGQDLGDAQLAVGLIDGIYKIVEPAFLEANNKRNERSSLKKFLGSWWKEAFEFGACMVPVLDIGDFEKHLQQTNGVLKPRGNCTAGSPWGYLLHALAINPGDGILTWKPASKARWDMLHGELAMDVRGTSFCHLINLYKVTDPIKEEIIVEGRPQERSSCRLSFGWLAWTSTDAAHMIASFEPDTIPKLNGRKKPFGNIGPMLGEAFWTSYEAALEHGISDPQMMWPNPNTTPLSERLQCLVTNIERLMDGRALLLTQAWLEQASRIKIRAMTNGGKDDTFLKDSYKTLAQHPRRARLSESRHSDLQKALEKCFSAEGSRFKLIYAGNASTASETSMRRGFMSDFFLSPLTLLEDTLESYSADDPVSWKGQLYASKSLVIAVAQVDPVIMHAEQIHLLTFAPEDPLWDARVHL